MDTISQIHDHIYSVIRSLGDDYVALYEPWIDDEEIAGIRSSFSRCDDNFFFAEWNGDDSECSKIKSALGNLRHYEDDMVFDTIAEEFHPEDIDEDEWDERYSEHEWIDRKIEKIEALVSYLENELSARKCPE